MLVVLERVGYITSEDIITISKRMAPISSIMSMH
jgi:hypothetical protein